MMQSWPAIRSMLWKFLYGFVVALIAFSQGWIEVNKDPQAWAIAPFLAGLGTAFLGFAKDFVFRVLVPSLFGGDVYRP